MSLQQTKNASKRMTIESLPNTQVRSRNDIYEQDAIDQEVVKEGAERMDALMRQMLGGGGDGDEETEEGEAEKPQDMEDVKVEEDGFSFRLFASQPVSTVNIQDMQDNTDNWSKFVADQQVYEFDETDPVFVARAKQAAINYDTIIQQSTIPYPAMRFSRRVIHITEKDEDKSTMKKKRKSKKCRDFEKAVKEGKIDLKPNMRNPNTPDGWPGWPGQLTRMAIIDYDDDKRKNRYASSSRGGRGGGTFRGAASRGNSRGGMMARGRGRGRLF